MSKFSVGDTVRVTKPASERFDKTLKIQGTWRGSREWVYNFNVDGVLFSFAEHHLILAEPTATETINEMLAESDPSTAVLVAANNSAFIAGLIKKDAAKKSVGMDEREIDGEYVPGLNARAKTLRTAEKLINGDRARDYGEPRENFGRIASLWNAQFGKKLRVPFTAGDVALALVHLKLSRLANTPGHEDSFIDACGYLALGAEIAEGL